ncbi:uncharacterized protein P884DRAFT_192147 [Thermothelomyces heterothallicus CBS 202.75]|uniref:uncharacterized protein n=1 Tax=Thermothelomyces heterothallicus CBS 202.75 TaxID=1149848 RepID=UPI003743043A
MSPLRLGLRARELLPVKGAGPTRSVLVLANCAGVRRPRGLPSAASFTTSQEKSRIHLNRPSMEIMAPRVGQHTAPKVETSQRVAAMSADTLAETLSVVLPGSFVLPPLSQFPDSLGKKIRFLSQWMYIKIQEMLTNGAVVFSSKPSIFKRASFEAKRGSLIPTAKALHRAVAEALAAGNKSAIGKICTRDYAGPLLASIDARPRGHRYSWELVKYTNKLFYPSLKSHRISPISTERESPLIRQAIVAISSKQRVVVYNAKGEVVPGSEREMDVVENVAIACVIDPKRGWKQSKWRYLGTIKPTTLESWQEERAMVSRRLLGN